MKGKIIVAITTRNDGKPKDRDRILSPQGVCQTLRTTDYRDPPKIIERTAKE